MSIFYNHDIFWVPACRKIPKPQYIVRPCGPKGTPGVRGEYDTFELAHKAARRYADDQLGLRHE